MLLTKESVLTRQFVTGSAQHCQSFQISTALPVFPDQHSTASWSWHRRTAADIIDLWNEMLVARYLHLTNKRTLSGTFISVECKEQMFHISSQWTYYLALNIALETSKLIVVLLPLLICDWKIITFVWKLLLQTLLGLRYCILNLVFWGITFDSETWFKTFLLRNYPHCSRHCWLSFK